MDERFSLREMQLLLTNSVPGQITIGWMFAQSHADRVELIEKALDWISSEFTRTRQDRQDRDEDGLSVDIVTALSAMSLDASHDTAYGGHCDIVIRGAGNFLWLGEAKIHDSYDWLLKGFQQLDTRYATALPGQDHGGMVIFSYNANTKSLMDTWKERLVAARPDVSASECAKNALAFRSVHKHTGSGLDFNVRHVPVSLYFKPLDRK